MDNTVFEKITHGRGRGEKRRRSPRTPSGAYSGSLSPQGASSGSRSPEGPCHLTCSRSPQATYSLDQSKEQTFSSKSPKTNGRLMPDRRSVSPQGASSGSSSPQRSLSPAASLAGSPSPQLLAGKDPPPQGLSATSGFNNHPKSPFVISVNVTKVRKERASAGRGSHDQSAAAPVPNQPRARYGIKITNFDLSVKTYELERILRDFFARYGKLLSFAFHGKLNNRYCLLSYQRELERDKALAVNGQKGPLQLSLHVVPWGISKSPESFEPKGFGIKILNIGLGKGQDNIISTIKEEFKRFGDITYIGVVSDCEDRYVKLFYRHKYEQAAALSQSNRFSAQFRTLKVRPWIDVPEHTDSQNVKFQKDKTGSQIKRQRMDQSLLSSASVNLRRDGGPRSVIPAGGSRSVIPANIPFQVTDVLRQSHNNTFLPFTRSMPSTSQPSSTNLPNMFNHTRDWNSMGQPFHRGVEHSRSWLPNLNVPLNSHQISTNSSTAIKDRPDFMMSQYRHDHGNVLSSPKLPNVSDKAENVTAQKSYGTLVRSGSSHHKASLTLWVNNLEDKTTKADLWTIFQPFGEIQHIEIREGFRNTGKQAFLQYLNLSSVYEAIQQMDGKYMGNTKLQLDFAYLQQPTNCVWVCGLYTIVNGWYLENIFRQFGPVVKLLHDSNKNTALVLYNDIASAIKAVNEINTRSVFGCQVRLGFANRRCQLGFCHSMESSGQNVGDFYQLVGETSEWLLRKANIERMLTLPS